MGLLGDYLPGLPDDPNQNSATRQGLLAFGAAMLGGRGNFGQILGQGLASGAGGYNSAMQALQQKALADAQTKHYTLENDATQSALDQKKRISEGLAQFNAQQPPSAAASLVTSAPQAAPLSAEPQASPAPDAGLPLSMFPQANAAPLRPAAPVSALPQVGAAPADGGPDADYAKAVALYQYLNTNFPGSDEAKAAQKAVETLAPKYSTEFRVARGPDGVLRNYLVSERGYLKDAGVGVKPSMKSTDLGGVVRFDDENQITPGQTFTKTVTPGEALQSQDQAKTRAQQERHWSAEREDANAPAKPNETLARQIAFYKQPPLGAWNLNKPWGQATMDEVLRLNPDYDAAQYAPRASALKSFAAGGKDAANIESVNTGMNHLESLRELALAAKNRDMKAWNRIANAWATQTGQAAPTNMRMASEMIAPEVVKAVAGVGATGEERTHMAEALTGKGTYAPDQIIGALDTAKELFAGRLKEKKRSYERSTKMTDFEEAYLSPAARKLLEPSGKSDAPAKPTVKPVTALPQKGGVPSDINSLLNKYGKP